MNNFIGEYQIDLELVDDILKYFVDNSHLHVQGKVGEYVVRKDVKDSIDIGIDKNNFSYPFNHYRDELQYCLNEYIDEYDILKNSDGFNLNNDYQIQHYKKGGGFKEYHFETMGPGQSKRILVFMTYLNDVQDGGTNFKYYNYTVKAEKGKTIIWPASFTHTHVGQISHTKEKTIVTGWFEFND